MHATRLVALRAMVVSVLVGGTMVPATLAVDRNRAIIRQFAIVQFDHSTCVAGEMLIGTYVIVHDRSKMVRGEPCTALYRVGGRTRPLEEVVSFHCIPHERRVAASLTTTLSVDPALGIDTLIEYQFAGDSEGHGVPILALASDRLHLPASGVTAW
ncbi:unnamed protein product [uncultured bacterium]|nr:unnamed protein product [uncultured bacterium]